MRYLRKGALAAMAAAAVVVASSPAQAASTPAYKVVNVGAYGGEPSIVSDNLGQLYDTTPSGGTITYTSTNKGASWSQVTTADPISGDDCLATDQANSVYLCNLAGSEGVAPLQADVWKSVDHGKTWTHGAGALPQCATSCSPFGVDRDWVAASIPAGGTTASAEVVLMYHDFYGPSQIWVNISHDGGATFGAPQEVLASPAVTPGAIAGTLVAEGYTFCNTVPAGVSIAPPGTPHAGRITVAWIAADLAQNASGCNVSMLQSFHTVWVSYSDDNGATWTPQQAWDAGIGHDTSTPFVAYTTDTQGNPYFGLVVNASSNPATCSAESTAGTVQSDPSCEYDMYVVWSNNGGATWDGGGGLVPGSAAAAYRVNPARETGTHFFPAISAGDPGKVDVAYLSTPTVIATAPTGKPLPGGGEGAEWHLKMAQSLDLRAGSPTWTTSTVRPEPVHVGDQQGVRRPTSGASACVDDFDPRARVGRISRHDHVGRAPYRRERYAGRDGRPIRGAEG